MYMHRDLGLYAHVSSDFQESAYVGRENDLGFGGKSSVGFMGPVLQKL